MDLSAFPDMDIVTVNVSGSIFQIPRKTLQNLPDSLLAHKTGHSKNKPYVWKEVIERQRCLRV